MIKLKPDFCKEDLRQELVHLRDRFKKVADNPYIKEAMPQESYQSSYSMAALNDVIWMLDSRDDDFSIGRWNKIKDDNGYPKACCSSCCKKSDYEYDFCPFCGNQKRLIKIPDLKEDEPNA